MKPHQLRVHEHNSCVVPGRIGPSAGGEFSSPFSFDSQGIDLKGIGFDVDASALIDLYVSRNEPDLADDPATQLPYTQPHLDPAITWNIAGDFFVRPAAPSAPRQVLQATYGRRYVKLELRRGGPVTKIYPRS